MQEFQNANWVSQLTFLTDITSHMNDLNTKLQSSNQLFNKFWQYINAFERNMKLLKRQIAEKNFVPFSRLNIIQPTDNSIYINFYRTCENNLKYDLLICILKMLFSQSFDVKHESAHEDFQIVLIELEVMNFINLNLVLLLPL